MEDTVDTSSFPPGAAGKLPASGSDASHPIVPQYYSLIGFNILKTVKMLWFFSPSTQETKSRKVNVHLSGTRFIQEGRGKWPHETELLINPKQQTPEAELHKVPQHIWTSWGLLHMDSHLWCCICTKSCYHGIVPASQWVLFRSFLMSSNGRTGEHPSCRRRRSWSSAEFSLGKPLVNDWWRFLLQHELNFTSQTNPSFISKLRCYSENNFPPKSSFPFPFHFMSKHKDFFPDDHFSILESLQHPLFAWKG